MKIKLLLYQLNPVWKKKIRYTNYLYLAGCVKVYFWGCEGNKIKWKTIGINLKVKMCVCVWAYMRGENERKHIVLPYFSSSKKGKNSSTLLISSFRSNTELFSSNHVEVREKAVSLTINLCKLLHFVWASNLHLSFFSFFLSSALKWRQSILTISLIYSFFFSSFFFSRFFLVLFLFLYFLGDSWIE